MHSGTRIALIGDFNTQQKAHQAIPRALAAVPDAHVEAFWVSTDSVGDGSQLRDCSGIWCAPGMPYRSAEGALRAIRGAREGGIPFLGTSAGFQYTLIEFARNVLGIGDADHLKTNPKTTTPLIVPLGCALAGVKARVRFTPGSAIRKAYGKAESVEEYHCSFGLNGRYRPLIESGRMHTSAVDDQDEIRAVELDGHPFFAATLFQPEMTESNPFVAAFVAACARQNTKLTRVAS